MLDEFDWVNAMTDSLFLKVLAGCSVITFGIALERLYYFRKRSGSADLAFMGALEALRKGNVGEGGRGPEVFLLPEIDHAQAEPDGGAKLAV